MNLFLTKCLLGAMLVLSGCVASQPLNSQRANTKSTASGSLVSLMGGLRSFLGEATQIVRDAETLKREGETLAQ